MVQFFLTGEAWFNKHCCVSVRPVKLFSKNYKKINETSTWHNPTHWHSPTQFLQRGPTHPTTTTQTLPVVLLLTAEAKHVQYTKSYTSTHIVELTANLRLDEVKVWA